MKTATPTQISHMPHFQLSQRTREVLFSLCCTLIPYALAAALVFAYHEQFPK